MRDFVLVLAIMGVAITTAPALAEESGVTVWRGKPSQAGNHDSGRELAAWLRAAKEQFGTDASTIPKEIQKRFRHAFPAGLFDWARFTISSDDRLWRQAARLGYGDGAIVVLDNVILFRTADAARHHTVWHSALTQAQVFRRFGVDKGLERTIAAHQIMPQRRHLNPRRTHTYPYAFVYPEWDLPREPRSGAQETPTLPKRFIVKPRNPFGNE